MGVLDRFKTALGIKEKVDLRKRFEIKREAVSGTMSKFYQAYDRENDRVVGLKVLDSEKLAAFEGRFKGLKKPSEGEIAASLVHPNIVQTFEHGLSNRGEVYLVMEFLEGPGLHTLLNNRNAEMLDGIRVALIRQIAEAVAYVHKAGFIHRDLCPRNVMIEPRSGSLKLIDFGLTVPATPEFMKEGNRTGTPNYMAPELVKRQRTDQRLDVFSFGVTAYEICTFQLPWERGTTGQVAMTHATLAPVDITTLRPNIDPQLAKGIHRCIERNPSQRCPSMSEFLLMIRKVEHEDR